MVSWMFSLDPGFPFSKKKDKQGSLSDLNLRIDFRDFEIFRMVKNEGREGRTGPRPTSPRGRNRPRDPKAKPGRRSVRNAVGLRRFPFHLFS